MKGVSVHSAEQLEARHSIEIIATLSMRHTHTNAWSEDRRVCGEYSDRLIARLTQQFGRMMVLGMSRGNGSRIIYVACGALTISV